MRWTSKPGGIDSLRNCAIWASRARVNFCTRSPQTGTERMGIRNLRKPPQLSSPAGLRSWTMPLAAGEKASLGLMTLRSIVIAAVATAGFVGALLLVLMD